MKLTKISYFNIDMVKGSRGQVTDPLDKTMTEEAILDWVSTCPCDPDGKTILERGYEASQGSVQSAIYISEKRKKEE